MRSTTDFIYTISGKCIDPSNIKPEDISINDIAYGLSGIYRFNGQSRVSVARHSLALSQLTFLALGSYRASLYALLHDAPEAYLLDIPVPLKNFVNIESYAAASQRCFDSIKNGLALDGILEVSENDLIYIHRWDKALVVYEMSYAKKSYSTQTARMPWGENKFNYPSNGSQSIDTLPGDMSIIRDSYNWIVEDGEVPLKFKESYNMLVNLINKERLYDRKVQFS